MERTSTEVETKSVPSSCRQFHVFKCVKWEKSQFAKSQNLSDCAAVGEMSHS